MPQVGCLRAEAHAVYLGAGLNMTLLFLVLHKDRPVFLNEQRARSRQEGDGTSGCM